MDFSSENEQISSLLDDKPGNYPFLSNEDPVIFYNSNYERELLMAYNADFGESSSAVKSIDENELEPSWPNVGTCYPISEAEVPSTPKLLYSHRYNPYSSGPLIKESPEKCNVKKGRPSKAKSNTKMANYARNYREMKKVELSNAMYRIKELEHELHLLKDENEQMKRALEEATNHISHLKSVIDKDSQIASAVAKINQAGPSDYELKLCKHEDIGFNSFVSTPSNISSDWSDSKIKLEDIEPSRDLFSNDFSSFDRFLYT